MQAPRLRRHNICAAIALSACFISASNAHAVPLPKPRPASAQAAAKSATQSSTPLPLAASRPTDSRPAKPARAPAAPLARASSSETPQGDVQALNQVVSALKSGAPAQATQLAGGIGDPLARTLAEWLILRAEDNGATTERYRAFLAAHPSWPSLTFLRRRAEATLWDDKRDMGVTLTYFAHERPVSAKGAFALARAMIGRGDRAAATKLVRDAWRSERFASALEDAALSEFGPLLSAGDHKARMDLLLGYEDTGGGMRFAQKLGGTALAIAKARIAVIRKAGNAKALLDAVPADGRADAGYIFSRAQWLRRNDHTADAAQVMATAPRDAARLFNLDEWWVERRVLVRQLLDQGDPRSAYTTARDAARPDKRIYQTDQQFTAGWIALRYLNDPHTAQTHFARIAPNTDNPTALARAGYWQGRAAEALGHHGEARTAYQSAAEHSTSYYGQLARARLGLPTLALRNTPSSHGAGAAQLEIVRAVELLYALDQNDLVVPILAEIGERGDSAAIAALAALATENKDARGLLLIAKDAVNRGLPFDSDAYPLFGLPKYERIGPEIDPAVVYAISRQESGFNPRVVSPANAMGLMQVTPAAGKYVTKKFGVAYDGKRLLSDQVYNVQIGAAELADLIQYYNGSFIMTFAAYNAGRGRVKTWVERYGDPRDPKVDAVDWIERIPFSETRNYVQRILENVQVYRARFGGGNRLMIEADLHRGRSVE